jgi:hypothetical protein
MVLGVGTKSLSTFCQSLWRRLVKTERNSGSRDDGKAVRYVRRDEYRNGIATDQPQLRATTTLRPLIISKINLQM